MREKNAHLKKLPSLEQVKKDYFEDGLPLSKVAKKYGCSAGSVRMLFKKHGVDIRSCSESQQGERNPMFGVNHTKETREKMSGAYRDEVRDIHHQFGRGNPEEVKTPLQGRKMVRSSWEAAVCRYFNHNNIKYLYEPQFFEMVINDEKHVYKPDFLVMPEGKDEYYLEVKGMWKDLYHEKVDGLRKLGHKVVVW
jgi:hypothetical protein